MERRPRRNRWKYRALRCLVAIGVLLGTALQTATASPIRHFHTAHHSPWNWDIGVARQGALSIQSLGSWEHQLAIQLAGAHFYWPMNIHGRLRLHLTSVHGLLPNSVLVAYLHWKRSLNPARFDWFHPQWAPLLNQDLMARLALLNQPVLHSSQLIGPPPVPPGSILSSPPPTHSTPEPSTALIGLCLASAAAVAKRRGRRSEHA